MAGNVYLVGMMGAGKTTVGRKLAKATGSEFADLDQQIEQATGVSVATIFEIEGESGFRVREMQTLALVAQKGNLIVATGGGAVMNPLNRVRMLASGLVVYLHADPAMLYARTRHDKNRPLLQVANPLEKITRLTERRDPLYREIADAVIESGSGLVNSVNAIIQLIAEKNADTKCQFG